MSPVPTSRHLLIPFAGRGSPACRAALADLQLPRLEALLARLEPVASDARDESTLTPPQERALAAALGIAAADGCIPWAAREARQAGWGTHGVDDDSWGVVTLCHWQVGMDSVVLGDPSAIDIDAAESKALLDAARPFFDEDGIALHATSTPGRWLARGRIFHNLPTASIDRAVGQPIFDWAPLSDAARPLQRLQNEMQMLLYTQRVNDDRTARGVPPINSFWLSGTGSLPATYIDPSDEHPAPQVVEALRIPALRDDGPAWSASWGRVDAGPVADLLAAAVGGANVTLTLCGDRSAQRFGVRPRGVMQWARGLFHRPRAPAVLAEL